MVFMTIKEFKRSLKGEGVEGELVNTILISLITSFITLGVMYFFWLKNVDNFLGEYGYFIFFLILSIAIVLPSVRQVRAYKTFPCMTGMMIGMTIGMMSGFLIGFFIGATNGMFWGGVYGMAVGIIFGVWNGHYSGVMGAMEGLMAGFMGGLMGAMTAVMMYNDNLKAAGVIMYVVCGSILIGLNYMLFKETITEEESHKEDNKFTIVSSFILTTITTWFIVFGPRSVFLQ